ncbi:phospholipase D family protein [Paenibacillus tundrae]|uniref:Phosphatidylserine/phosphatidylglycerophosphate/ cardiolipin synthase-like enzyme n=1 Tax=Paenibacillus tundrae TaxID=528187 RepID=A0ABT9WF45_9BACL|nr:phospholipase D family protein [Paenibacillus tundrae]MDQ0171755.1 phosphatidylserine/phosphatidylglycerophosphate/cardiolipin synthase-like enzyme [Paenibacillus tundrae]
MKILNNLDSNHYIEMRELFREMDELHIISPFLMETFDLFFENFIAPSEIKRLVLVTTLRDNDPDVFKKSNSFHSLLYNCRLHKIDLQVHIDNKLHGKIYIGSKNSTPIKGIITSANFTESGLNLNHEWGVLIESPQDLTKILEDIFKISSCPLTTDDLTQIIMNIDRFTELFKPAESKLELVVSHLLQYPVTNKVPDVRYFIKPVGSKEDPFSVNRVLLNDIEAMHFSKRPNDVRIGDILICHGVGLTKLLGYFEVISDPYIWNSEYRWSWELKAKNLNPRYSSRWNDFNHTLANCIASFDPSLMVTHAQGKTLGGLQHGHDRLRLTDDFGLHLINIIDNSK